MMVCVGKRTGAGMQLSVAWIKIKNCNGDGLIAQPGLIQERHVTRALEIGPHQERGVNGDPGSAGRETSDSIQNQTSWTKATDRC